LTTLLGTAPINKAILTWRADSLPENWMSEIRRWERLDTIRTWIGLIAFALMLLARLLRV
jgi:hypothetical protein